MGQWWRTVNSNPKFDFVSLPFLQAFGQIHPPPFFLLFVFLPCPPLFRAFSFFPLPIQLQTFFPVPSHKPPSPSQSSLQPSPSSEITTPPPLPRHHPLNHRRQAPLPPHSKPPVATPRALGEGDNLAARCDSCAARRRPRPPPSQWNPITDPPDHCLCPHKPSNPSRRPLHHRRSPSSPSRPLPRSTAVSARAFNRADTTPPSPPTSERHHRRLPTEARVPSRSASTSLSLLSAAFAAASVLFSHSASPPASHLTQPAFLGRHLHHRSTEPRCPPRPCAAPSSPRSPTASPPQIRQPLTDRLADLLAHRTSPPAARDSCISDFLTPRTSFWSILRCPPSAGSPAATPAVDRGSPPSPALHASWSSPANTADAFGAARDSIPTVVTLLRWPCRRT